MIDNNGLASQEYKLEKWDYEALDALRNLAVSLKRELDKLMETPPDRAPEEIVTRCMIIEDMLRDIERQKYTIINLREVHLWEFRKKNGVE